MALTDSFPGPNGLTDSIEAGKDLAGLIVHSAAGAPRAGLLVGSATALVTGRTDLRVDIAPFKAALVRDGAVRFIANDTVAQSPTFTLPPANSRLDILYVKVNETPADATDGPVFGILEGSAAPIPMKPILNIDGALELATVPVASSDTGTAAAAIVQTALFTAATGGTVPIRTRQELAGWVPGEGGSVLVADIGQTLIRRGNAWFPTKDKWERKTFQTAAMNNGGTITTFTFPAMPYASEVVLEYVGQVGNAAAGPGLYIPAFFTDAGTLAEAQISAYNVLAGNWVGVPRDAVLTLPADAAATVTVRSSSNASGFWKGSVVARRSAVG